MQSGNFLPEFGNDMSMRNTRRPRSGDAALSHRRVRRDAAQPNMTNVTVSYSQLQLSYNIACNWLNFNCFSRKSMYLYVHRLLGPFFDM